MNILKYEVHPASSIYAHLKKDDSESVTGYWCRTLALATGNWLFITRHWQLLVRYFGTDKVPIFLQLRHYKATPAMALRRQILILVLLTYPLICQGQNVDNTAAQGQLQGKKISDIMYLAQVASANGQHENALQHLDQLLTHFKDTVVANFKLEEGFTYGLNKAPLHALCLFRKAEIYRSLQRPEPALEIYNEILKRYRNDWMSRDNSEGIGWGMPVPLQVLHQMKDMNESDDRAGERWPEQYKLACQNTRNSLAKVHATILYAGLLQKKGQLDEAATILKDIILYYDNQRIFTYKAQIDYSATAVSVLYDILFNSGTNEQETIAALSRIAEIKKETDNNVAFVARYFILKAMDNSTIDADTVVESFRKFLDTAPKGLDVTLDDGKVFAYRDVKARYDVINTYWKRRAEVKDSGCKLFARADSTSMVIADLPAHAFVTLQSPAPNSPSWCKVQNENGIIGWLSINKVTVAQNPFLFKDRRYSNWPLFDKNFKTVRHTSGKPIRRPVMRYALENIVSGRVVFFDVTNDEVPEVFAAEVDPLTREIYMVCIDGTQPKVRWRTKVSDCVRGKNGFVADSILHIGCYQLNAFSGEVVLKQKNSNASDELAAHMSGLRKFGGRYEPTYNDTSKIIAFTRDGKKNECKMVSYDRSTGNIAWTTIIPQCEEVVHKEIVDTKLVVITRSDRNVPKLYLSIFENATGALLKTSLLTNQLSYLFYAAPIRVKDKLLMAGNDSLHVFSFPDGKLQWKARGQVTSAALVSNTLYCVSGTLSERGTVYAYNFETGKRMWTYEIERPITAFLSSAGSLLAVNAGTTVYFIDDATPSRDGKSRN